MEITLKIDQRKKEAKALIEYLRNLPFVEVETKLGLGKMEKEKPRYNAETEIAIQDVRNGKTFKAKNSKDLFEKLGI